jgi:signal transduction histidine kinase
VKLLSKNPFHNLWDEISFNGIDSFENIKRVKTVILTNQISVTAAVLAVPHIFVYYSLGQLFAATIQLFTVILFISPFLFIRFKLYLTAKVLFVSFANINVFLTSSMLGRESGEQLAYLAIIFVVFVLFQDQAYLKIIFTLIPVFCFLILELSNYALFNLPHLISESHNFIFNFLATLAILVFIFYYYQNISNKEIIDILQNAKAQLEAIFNNSFDGILLLSVDDYTLQDCNVRAVQLFDAPNKDHFIRNNADHLSKQLSSKKEIDTIKTELQKTNKWSSEYELETTDGKLFWGDVAITTIKMDEFNRLLVRVTDISEKKTAAEKIKQTLEELKNRNFELDSFVYSTSHDLRAPIASILGLVNISRFENDLITLRNYFKLIEQSSLRLDKVISTILEYSKTVNAPVKISKVIIEELINQCYEDLRFFNNAERLKIRIELEQLEDLYSDEFRIQTILKNLISNSIKFLKTDCDNNYLRFDIKINKRQVEIMVTDNGVGIEKENQARLFEMFYRGTHKLSGSGLGLYITKLNVEKLNGTIKYESSYGLGTRFVIKFPNLINITHVNPLFSSVLAFTVQAPGWCQMFESYPFNQH